MKKHILFLLLLTIFYPTFAHTPLKQLSDSVCDRLIRIYQVDQTFRDIDILKEHSKVIYPVMQIYDSIFYQDVKSVLKEYKEVSEQTIPENYELRKSLLIESIGTVLLHNPKRVEEDKAFFMELCKKNHLSNDLLLLVLDKYYVFYKKQSLLGSAFRQMLPNPLLDPSQKALSDSLRLELGFSPLDSTYYAQ